MTTSQTTLFFCYQMKPCTAKCQVSECELSLLTCQSNIVSFISALFIPCIANFPIWSLIAIACRQQSINNSCPTVLCLSLLPKTRNIGDKLVCLHVQTMSCQSWSSLWCKLFSLDQSVRMEPLFNGCDRTICFTVDIGHLPILIMALLSKLNVVPLYIDACQLLCDAFIVGLIITIIIIIKTISTVVSH